MIARTSDRPLVVLSPRHLGLIVGLEPLFSDPSTHLMLVCPTCVREGRAWLDTHNAPDDAVWKIDCGCRDRRAQPADGVGPTPSHWGDLLWAADQALTSAHLAVRCRTRRCQRHPLEIRPTSDGWLVSCQCGRMTFRTRPSVVPAPAEERVS